MHACQIFVPGDVHHVRFMCFPLLCPLKNSRYIVSCDVSSLHFRYAEYSFLQTERIAFASRNLSLRPVLQMLLHEKFEDKEYPPLYELSYGPVLPLLYWVKRPSLHLDLLISFHYSLHNLLIGRIFKSSTALAGGLFTGILINGELATEQATCLGSRNFLPGIGSIAADKAVHQLSEGALEA